MLKGQVAWNKKEKVTIKCNICNKLFEVHPYRKDTAKFCSRKCYVKDWVKRIVKNTEHNFKKDHKAWNKNKKCPQLSNKNNGMWKGNNAKYRALHERVRIKRGKPNFCEVCGTSGKRKIYQWANLTGDYANIMDYKRMCVPCHSKYDNERRSENAKTDF